MMSRRDVMAGGLAGGALLLAGQAQGQARNPVWPDGARLVVSLSLMFEAGGRPPQMQPAPQASSLPGARPLPPEYQGRTYPDLPAETQIQYGVREGIPRLLDLYDRHRIKMSSFIVGQAAERHPALAREIVERGHEIAAHGRTHTAQYHLSREEERAFIADGVASLRRITGQNPVGYNCWALQRSVNTLSILQELGFLYHVDDVSRDEPFIVPVNGRDFAVVPYTKQNNDVEVLEIHHLPIDHWAGVLRREFDQLYAEAERRRRMMVISTHDRFAGRPAPTNVLSEFLTYAQGKPGVAFLRKDAIARFALRSPLTPREREAS